MENRVDSILFKYREADPTVRLHMFLDHRDLRGHFTEINRGEMPQPSLAPKVLFRLPGPCLSVFRRLASAVNCLISLPFDKNSFFGEGKAYRRN
ncbi:MAG: hypothetical protein JSV50_00990 [Desulfobacteraceae bacterium]|nr:MAG: hypothetical protein JSV50_00990 [Desulfobacteraceae bacterium]